MKMYRLRHLKSKSIQTLTEDEYQELKGRGWLGRYAVEDVTVSQVKSQFFQPPALIAIKAKVQEVKTETKEPEVEMVAEGLPVEPKKRGRPKKEQNA